MCENFHWTLQVHLIGGRVYWAVTDRGGRKGDRLVQNGVIEEPMAALYHSPTTHLMEAAYEAYRAIGE